MGNEATTLTPQPGSIPKGQWAGMIPCCIGEENGIGYVLLAVYPTSASHVGGWNPLWGSTDDTDIDMQHTAAREAEEEGRTAVGTVNFIRDLLLDDRAYAIIFEGCFLAGYGKLNKAERQWIVDYHRKKCLTSPSNILNIGLTNPLNKFSWEMRRLKWFKVVTLKKEAQAARAEKREMEHIAKNRIRPFFEATLRKSVDWEDGPLAQLAVGEYPFPDAPDRWRQWREGKWVAADGSTN